MKNSKKKAANTAGSCSAKISIQPGPLVVRGTLYKIYFESLYDEKGNRTPDRVYVVMVLADTLEQAMAKCKQVYPNEQISHASSERKLRDSKPTTEVLIF